MISTSWCSVQSVRLPELSRNQTTAATSDSCKGLHASQIQMLKHHLVTRVHSKKTSSQNRCPFLILFCVHGVLKKLCISTLTTHLFAVYQFLIFYKLIVNFIYPFKRSFLSILCFGFVTASWTPVLLSSKTSRWRRRPKLHCSPPQSNLELKTFQVQGGRVMGSLSRQSEAIIHIEAIHSSAPFCPFSVLDLLQPVGRQYCYPAKHLGDEEGQSFIAHHHSPTWN